MVNATVNGDWITPHSSGDDSNLSFPAFGADSHYKGIEFQYSLKKTSSEQGDQYNIVIKYSDKRNNLDVIEDEIFAFNITPFCPNGEISQEQLGVKAKEIVRMVHSATLAFSTLNEAMDKIDYIDISKAFEKANESDKGTVASGIENLLNAHFSQIHTSDNKDIDQTDKLNVKTYAKKSQTKNEAQKANHVTLKFFKGLRKLNENPLKKGAVIEDSLDFPTGTGSGSSMSTHQTHATGSTHPSGGGGGTPPPLPDRAGGTPPPTGKGGVPLPDGGRGLPSGAGLSPESLQRLRQTQQAQNITHVSIPKSGELQTIASKCKDVLGKLGKFEAATAPPNSEKTSQESLKKEVDDALTSAKGVQTKYGKTSELNLLDDDTTGEPNKTSYDEIKDHIPELEKAKKILDETQTGSTSSSKKSQDSAAKRLEARKEAEIDASNPFSIPELKGELESALRRLDSTQLKEGEASPSPKELGELLKKASQTACSDDPEIQKTKKKIIEEHGKRFEGLKEACNQASNKLANDDIKDLEEAFQAFQDAKEWSDAFQGTELEGPQKDHGLGLAKGKLLGKLKENGVENEENFNQKLTDAYVDGRVQPRTQKRLNRLLRHHKKLTENSQNDDGISPKKDPLEKKLGYDISKIAQTIKTLPTGKDEEKEKARNLLSQSRNIQSEIESSSLPNTSKQVLKDANNDLSHRLAPGGSLGDDSQSGSASALGDKSFDQLLDEHFATNAADATSSNPFSDLTTSYHHSVSPSIHTDTSSKKGSTATLDSHNSYEGDFLTSSKSTTTHHSIDLSNSQAKKTSSSPVQHQSSSSQQAGDLFSKLNPPGGGGGVLSSGSVGGGDGGVDLQTQLDTLSSKGLSSLDREGLEENEKKLNDLEESLNSPESGKTQEQTQKIAQGELKKYAGTIQDPKADLEGLTPQADLEGLTPPKVVQAQGEIDTGITAEGKKILEALKGQETTFTSTQAAGAAQGQFDKKVADEIRQVVQDKMKVQEGEGLQISPDSQNAQSVLFKALNPIFKKDIEGLWQSGDKSKQLFSQLEEATARSDQMLKQIETLKGALESDGEGNKEIVDQAASNDQNLNKLEEAITAFKGRVDLHLKEIKEKKDFLEDAKKGLDDALKTIYQINEDSQNLETLEEKHKSFAKALGEFKGVLPNDKDPYRLEFQKEQEITESNYQTKKGELENNIKNNDGSVKGARSKIATINFSDADLLSQLEEFKEAFNSLENVKKQVLKTEVSAKKDQMLDHVKGVLGKFTSSEGPESKDKDGLMTCQTALISFGNCYGSLPNLKDGEKQGFQETKNQLLSQIETHLQTIQNKEDEQNLYQTPLTSEGIQGLHEILKNLKVLKLLTIDDCEDNSIEWSTLKGGFNTTEAQLNKKIDQLKKEIQEIDASSKGPTDKLKEQNTKYGEIVKLCEDAQKIYQLFHNKGKEDARNALKNPILELETTLKANQGLIASEDAISKSQSNENIIQIEAIGAFESFQDYQSLAKAYNDQDFSDDNGAFKREVYTQKFVEKFKAVLPGELETIEGEIDQHPGKEHAFVMEKVGAFMSEVDAVLGTLKETRIDSLIKVSDELQDFRDNQLDEKFEDFLGLSDRYANLHTEFSDQFSCSERANIQKLFESDEPEGKRFQQAFISMFMNPLRKDPIISCKLLSHEILVLETENKGLRKDREAVDNDLGGQRETKQGFGRKAKKGASSSKKQPLEQIEEKIEQLSQDGSENKTELNKYKNAKKSLLLEKEIASLKEKLAENKKKLNQEDHNTLEQSGEFTAHYKMLEESTLKDLRMYLVGNGLMDHDQVLPSAEEFLATALADITQPNSNLVAQRRYTARKESLDKHIGRREKLQRRCEGLLLARLDEASLLDPKKHHMVLQPDVKTQIQQGIPEPKVSRNQDYLKQCSNWDAKPGEQYTKVFEGQISPFSNFTDGVQAKKEGGSEILKMGNEETSLVFSHEGQRWLCDLGGERWEFNPKILEDYPDLEVPSFATTTSSGAKGWLPLRKPESGEMVILARDDRDNARLRLFKVVGDSEGPYLAYRHKRGDLEYTKTCQSALKCLVQAQAKTLSESAGQQDISNAQRLLQMSYRQLMGAHENRERQQVKKELVKNVREISNYLQSGCLKSIQDDSYISLYDPTKVKTEKLLRIDVVGRNVAHRTIQKDEHWSGKLEKRREKVDIEEGDPRFFEEDAFERCASTLDRAVGILHGGEFKEPHKFANLNLHKATRKQEVQDKKSILSQCKIEGELDDAKKSVTLKSLNYHQAKQRDKVASLHREEARMHAKLEKIVDEVRGETGIDTVDQLISYFAKGDVPKSYSGSEKLPIYVQTIGSYLQLNIEADMRGALLDEYDDLKTSLEACSDGGSLDEYHKKLYVCTQRTNAIESGMQKLQGLPFNENLRVILNCGYRTRKILRPEQVEQLIRVFQTFQNLERASFEDDGFKQVLNLGTGYGKTFLCMPIADNARQKINRAGHERAIVVMSRGDAQVDFNKEMSQYFANVGVDFLSVGFADRTPSFWKNEEEILALRDKMKTCIKSGDVKPIGCSMEDRVMLSFMVKHYQAAAKSSKSEKKDILQALQEMEAILNKSFCILDEWDSQIMPFRLETAQELTGKVNENLKALGVSNILKRSSGYKEDVGFTVEAILQNHNNYVGGLKDHLALSATRGTQQALNIMSGVDVSKGESDANVKTDPMRGIGRTMEVFSRSECQEISGVKADFDNKMQENFEANPSEDVIFIDSGSYYKEGETSDVDAAKEFFTHRQSALKADMDKALQNIGKNYDTLKQNPKVIEALSPDTRERVYAYQSFSVVYYRSHEEGGKKERRRFIMKADNYEGGGVLLSEGERAQMLRTQGKGVSYFLSKQEEVGIDVPQSFQHKVYATGTASVEHLSQIIGRGRKLDEGQKLCLISKEKDLQLSPPVGITGKVLTPSQGKSPLAKLGASEARVFIDNGDRYQGSNDKEAAKNFFKELYNSLSDDQKKSTLEVAYLDTLDDKKILFGTPRSINEKPYENTDNAVLFLSKAQYANVNIRQKALGHGSDKAISLSDICDAKECNTKLGGRSLDFYICDDIKTRYLYKVAEQEITESRIVQTKATLNGKLSGIYENTRRVMQEALEAEAKGKQSAVFEATSYPKMSEKEVASGMEEGYKQDVEQLVTDYKKGVEGWHGTRYQILQEKIDSLSWEIAAVKKWINAEKQGEVPVERLQQEYEEMESTLEQQKEDLKQLERDKKMHVEQNQGAIQGKLNEIVTAYGDQNVKLVSGLTAHKRTGKRKGRDRLKNLCNEGDFVSLTKGLGKKTFGIDGAKDMGSIRDVFTKIGQIQLKGTDKCSIDKSLSDNHTFHPKPATPLNYYESKKEGLREKIDSGVDQLETDNANIANKESEIKQQKQKIEKHFQDIEKTLNQQIRDVQKEQKGLDARKEKLEQLIDSTSEEQKQSALKNEFPKLQQESGGLARLIESRKQETS